MKKVFTFIFVCLITLGAFGQTNGQFRNGAVFKQPSQADVAVPGIELPSSPMVMIPQTTLIGKTKYDVVTNNALSNRFYRFDDGRMVATWIGGMQDAAFPDRGSFYNYFNGSEWTSNPDNIVRIEDVRSGWVSWSPFGNGEVIASHDGADGINIWTRATVGTGNWTKKTTVMGGDTWPRICVNDGVMHLISCQQDASGTPASTVLYYSKSTDGGETWSTNHVPFTSHFPDYNYSGYCYSADSYVWAEPVNGVIAFSLASSLGDLLIYKSTDNGANWQKIVVWESPVKGFVPPTQTPDVTCPGGAQSLVIDTEGKCHLVFTANVSYASDNIYTYWEESWAYYWNENLPPFTGPDPYEVFNPIVNPNVALDNKLILPMGFDFTGYGVDIAMVVSDGSTGMIKGISMAAAGPNRMILTLDVHDPRYIFSDSYYFTRIFACSYIKDGSGWKLDENWITEDDMKSYDYYTGAQIDNKGWFHVTKDNSFTYKDCTYSQVVVDNSDAADAKFYIFFKVDDVPGCAASTATNHNPQNGDYIINEIIMYSDYVTLVEPGETPPTILTSSLPNGKKGVAYSQTLSANGSQPITWSIEDETDLPPGLTFSSTGVISGTPTEDDVEDTVYPFKVKATNEFGEDEKELSITIAAGVGIITFETSPVKVYPNPANDILYIVNENQQSMQVKLVDFMGREVMNQNITDKTGMDMSKLPAGIYNLTIKYGNTVENRKIVKN